jgi:hypothetical protein
VTRPRRHVAPGGPGSGPRHGAPPAAPGLDSAIAPPGPIAGAALWRQVVAAAGGRCECAGECGSKHRDGNGICLQEDTAWSPLHAVARDPAAGTVAEMCMGAAELMAVCDGCHGRLLARRRNAERLATAEAPGGHEGLW